MKNEFLLVVDDDLEILVLLSRFLKEHQFDVATAANVREAENIMRTQSIDLIVLDVMMPGEDGLVFCRRLRESSNIPVIMLTAMGDDVDRIVGLELGADDYIGKPFNPRELLARIRSVLRRTSRPGRNNGAHSGKQKKCYTFDQWQLDPTRRELRDKDGVIVALTSGEFDLLLTFLEHPQETLTRDQLLDLCKGRGANPFDRSIDVQLSRLRKKIEPDSKHPSLIKTIRNGGYILAVSVERS